MVRAARRWSVLSVGATASLCYPMGLIASRLLAPRAPLSLDGMAYLDREHPNDAGAIRWLATQVRGTPVVLETTGDPYSYFARVSSNTGLPTLLGWANHEGVWRGDDPRIARRARDVEAIYGDVDLRRAGPLLDRHRVRYVFIGELERQEFAAEGLDKFAPASGAVRARLPLGHDRGVRGSRHDRQRVTAGVRNGRMAIVE